MYRTEKQTLTRTSEIGRSLGETSTEQQSITKEAQPKRDGVLIVFDQLFGAHRTERDDPPCRYGWVKPMTTHNPPRIEFTCCAHLATKEQTERSAKIDRSVALSTSV